MDGGNPNSIESSTNSAPEAPKTAPVEKPKQVDKLGAERALTALNQVTPGIPDRADLQNLATAGRPITPFEQMIQDSPNNLITPTARRIGEESDQPAWVRGYTSGIDAILNDTNPSLDRAHMIQEMTDKIKGRIPDDVIEQILKSRGLKTVKANQESVTQQLQEQVNEGRNPLSEQEITEMARRAHEFVAHHPNDLSDPNASEFMKRMAAGTSYEPADMMLGLQRVDPQLGFQFEAHGIAKGSGYSEQVAALNELLTRGIDPQRTFYTATLRTRDGSPAPDGSTGKFDIAPFVLIGEKGKKINESGFKGVIIEEPFYAEIPQLQQHFPDIKFIKAADLPAALEQWGQATPAGNGQSVVPEKAPLTQGQQVGEAFKGLGGLGNSITERAFQDKIMKALNTSGTDQEKQAYIQGEVDKLKARGIDPNVIAQWVQTAIGNKGTITRS